MKILAFSEKFVKIRSMKPIVVVKFGSSVLTAVDRKPNLEVLREICRQLAELNKKYRLIVVSSGAVTFGRDRLAQFRGTLPGRRAAASIGNVEMIRRYEEAFEPHGITVAQALLERHHFSDRRQFVTLRETFERLWVSGVIPIVNENDVVSNVEIKFSDNDHLATLLAAGFSAQKMLLGTSVEGLLDADGGVIKKIEQFNDDLFGLAKGSSEHGLGGMRSKLHCAKLATRLGTETIIFDGRMPGELIRAESGEVGTHCAAQSCDISTHQRWMASGSVIAGKITVDAGAANALKEGKSLLAVGVSALEGHWEAGDFIEMHLEDGHFVGVARAQVGAWDLEPQLGQHGMQVAHSDEIVLF